MNAPGVWPPGVRRFLLTTRAGRMALILPRLWLAVRKSGALRRLGLAVVWAFRSRDIAPRSYHTSALNQDELCWTVARVSGCPVRQVMAYRDEILGDQALADYIRGAVAAAPEVWSHDADYRLGRRLAFYLLTRALRPPRVIEAGVDRGYGAILILRALERNAADGQGGDYLGLDAKGEDDAFLYTGYPRRSGRVDRGDAAALLRACDPVPGTLIIHDVCAEPGHIADFIAAVDNHLAGESVLVSSWTLPAFSAFALRRGLLLATHADSAWGHWATPSRLCLVFSGRQ